MTRYEEILLQLYEILKSYAKDGQSLSEDTELLSDLGLDSMKVMQLLLETEERFDISIPLKHHPERPDRQGFCPTDRAAHGATIMALWRNSTTSLKLTRRLCGRARTRSV